MIFQQYFGASERTSRQAQRSDVFKFDRGYDNYFGSRGDQSEEDEDVYRYAGILAPAGPGVPVNSKGQQCGSGAECGNNCYGCCSISRCIAEKGSRVR